MPFRPIMNLYVGKGPSAHLENENVGDSEITN